MKFEDDFIDRELNDELPEEINNFTFDLNLEQKIEIKKIPRISKTNGSGLALIGRSAYHQASQSYLTTLCLTILYIPICPLKRYRVKKGDNSEKWNTKISKYTFLWEVPLSKEEKLVKIFIHISFALLILFLFWIALK